MTDTVARQLFEAPRYRPRFVSQSKDKGSARDYHKRFSLERDRARVNRIMDRNRDSETDRDTVSAPSSTRTSTLSNTTSSTSSSIHKAMELDFAAVQTRIQLLEERLAVQRRQCIEAAHLGDSHMAELEAKFQAYFKEYQVLGTSLEQLQARTEGIEARASPQLPTQEVAVQGSRPKTTTSKADTKAGQTGKKAETLAFGLYTGDLALHKRLRPALGLLAALMAALLLHEALNIYADMTRKVQCY